MITTTSGVVQQLGIYFCYYFACPANLPEGLYILPMFFLYFISFISFLYF